MWTLRWPPRFPRPSARLRQHRLPPPCRPRRLSRCPSPCRLRRLSRRPNPRGQPRPRPLGHPSRRPRPSPRRLRAPVASRSPFPRLCARVSVGVSPSRTRSCSGPRCSRRPTAP
ncbi:hypothetical protein D3230_01570 [Leucobacter chromiireducens subsp. solipictus]|uniref:Uncharacterized protein n=1 Tax=Leucobacter chromiireducens subsp. solipictus TaxID=398235 RepID=A0ABS1SBS3_9MICO|nr:hypothetical protein [Leucobacter chromiireducens subsp. solipictus]